jgi:hypothetical protein
MTYPKQTVALRPTRGFISDTPAHEVGPDFFTLMTNVITRGGFSQRIPGSRSVYGTALGVAAPGQLMHAINAEVSGTNYWLIFEEDGTAWYVEGANATQMDNSLLQTVNDPVDFSSGLLNGVPVISNGADEPVFWAGPGNLATLTDWTATESCGFLAVSQYHIFALDISGPGGTFPSLVKWSDAAEPGTIPDSWTAAADNEAGDVELSDSPGGLVCAYPLRDSLMIYKRSAMYQATYVGGNNIFNFRKVQSTSGALTRRSVCDVNGMHLVVSDGDILLTDGSTRRSIGEARVKDWFFNQLDQDNYPNTFCTYNRAQHEVLIGFPTSGAEFCNSALVYNVDLDSFGVRDLDDLTHAPVGYVNDTAESNTWADRTETWAAAVGAWGSSTVAAARDSMVFIHTDEMHQQDVDDATAVSAVLAKYSMDFGDSTRVKFLKRIHVQARANYGTLVVRAGSQMSPNDSITWSNQVSITDPDQIVNLFAQGRYISVEVTSTGSDVWKLTGLDLELEQRGYF